MGHVTKKRVIPSNDNASLSHALGLSTETTLEHFPCINEKEADVFINDCEKDMAVADSLEKGLVNELKEEVNQGLLMTNILLYAEEKGLLKQSLKTLVKKYHQSEAGIDDGGTNEKREEHITELKDAMTKQHSSKGGDKQTKKTEE